MAKFKPGISGNRKGRPVGSRSRSTEQIRVALMKFIDENIDSLQDEFKHLEPKEKFAALNQLLRHCLPPPQDELMRLSDEDLDRLIERLKQDRINNMTISHKKAE